MNLTGVKNIASFCTQIFFFKTLGNDLLKVCLSFSPTPPLFDQLESLLSLGWGAELSGVDPSGGHHAKRCALERSSRLNPLC